MSPIIITGEWGLVTNYIVSHSDTYLRESSQCHSVVWGTDVQLWECHRCLGPIEVEAIYCPECEASLHRIKGLSQLIKLVVIISIVFFGIAIAAYVRLQMTFSGGINFAPYAFCLISIVPIVLVLLVVPILLYLRNRANV